MEYFNGFTWALPKAFSDAIANCRFEEGDIIYDSKSAYQEWEKAVETTKYCIKIKYPKRTSRSLINEHSSVQLENWNSNVRFELMNIKEKKKKLIETTQGALFSLLWKGDFHYIELENSLVEPPLFLKDIKKNHNSILKEAIPKCKKLASGRIFFIMPYDPTNDVSMKKHQDLNEALFRMQKLKLIQLSLEESGLIKWEQVFPVITIDLFIFEDDNIEEIELIIKNLFYKPTTTSKRQAFKLSTHGILEKGY